MAISMVKDVTNTEPVPSEIKDVLHNYVDIMRDSLPKMLPSHRGIDHEIKLLLGVKPPAKNAYQMASPATAKLRKQLD